MRSPFDYFDHIFCINLARREDRWASATKEFERLGILHRVQRFEAIERSNGREGCLLSHQKCIQLAKEMGRKQFLIFEDDLLLESRNLEDYRVAVEELMRIPDWQLFYLGGRLVGERETTSINLIRGKFFSTHAYALSERVYPLLNKMAIPLDVWWANNVSAAFAPKRSLISQRNGYSDIERRLVYGKGAEFNLSRITIKPRNEVGRSMLKALYYVVRRINTLRSHLSRVWT